MKRRGWTFAISLGDWGGFYFHKGYSVRLCLGSIAFTLIPLDLDVLLDANLPPKSNKSKYSSAIASARKANPDFDQLETWEGN